MRLSTTVITTLVAAPLALLSGMAWDQEAVSAPDDQCYEIRYHDRFGNHYTRVTCDNYVDPVPRHYPYHHDGNHWYWYDHGGHSWYHHDGRQWNAHQGHVPHARVPLGGVHRGGGHQGGGHRGSHR